MAATPCMNLQVAKCSETNTDYSLSGCTENVCLAPTDVTGHRGSNVCMRMFVVFYCYSQFISLQTVLLDPFGTRVGQGLLWHHFLVNQCTQRTCWLQRLFLVSANPGTFLGGYTVTEKNLRQPFFEVWLPLEVAGFTDLRWPFMLYLKYFIIFLSFFQTSG